MFSFITIQRLKPCMIVLYQKEQNMHIKDEGKEDMTDIFPVNPSTFFFKLFCHLNIKPRIYIPK